MEHSRPVPLRQRQKAATREALVDAAIEVFAETGYPHTRIDDIAAHAGASRATFYLHFGSKAALLEEIMSRAADGFEPSYDDLAALLRSRDDAGLHRWIAGALANWADTAHLMRPVYEAAESDARLAARLLPDALPGAHRLARALRDGGVVDDEEDAAITAMVLLAPLHVAFRRRAGGHPVDEDRLAAVTAAMWAAYRAPAR
ncbi:MULTISPECIES: TetR/AcrR family transcriptional regulator [unclassified Microbacterium]|uniref:TetR/AcrR family transcriptional regulator n=1 Tax=unclassified Microbacterium TaxID=2609290 RepID=UPI00300F91A0